MAGNFRMSFNWTWNVKKQPWTDEKSRYRSIYFGTRVVHFLSSFDIRCEWMLSLDSQSTYKRSGKNITQHEKQENGMVIVYEREIIGDELHVVSPSFPSPSQHELRVKTIPYFVCFIRKFPAGILNRTGSSRSCECLSCCYDCFSSKNRISRTPPPLKLKYKNFKQLQMALLFCLLTV